MHELSVVNSLIDLCEKNAKEQNANKIVRVEVKVGKLSGVEPHFLKLTFDAFKEKTICEDSELFINMQDVVVKCFSCGGESVITDNEFVCKNCGSYEIKTIDGEELMLMRLEME